MSAEPRSTEADDRLLLALTTEHFTLQTARSATISESAGRAALFLFMVSSGLVALGFAGQASELGAPFILLALTVLPTLVALGALTYLRLLQSAIEDLRYASEIEEIRRHYRALSPGAARFFAAMADVGGPAAGRWHLLSHSATMVLVVDSVLAGGGAAVATWALAAPLQAVASAGVALGAATAVAFLAHQARSWRAVTTATARPRPERG